MGPCSSRSCRMRFKKAKAAERQPDCLVSSSASLQIDEDAIKVLLYGSGRLH